MTAILSVLLETCVCGVDVRSLGLVDRKILNIQFRPQEVFRYHMPGIKTWLNFPKLVSF
jgi:hypothetical protein